MANSNLIPKRIVNSAGVETTVYVRPDQLQAFEASLKTVGAPTLAGGHRPSYPHVWQTGFRAEPPYLPTDLDYVDGIPFQTGDDATGGYQYIDPSDTATIQLHPGDQVVLAVAIRPDILDAVSNQPFAVGAAVARNHRSRGRDESGPYRRHPDPELGGHVYLTSFVVTDDGDSSYDRYQGEYADRLLDRLRNMDGIDPDAVGEYDDEDRVNSPITVSLLEIRRRDEVTARLLAHDEAAEQMVSSMTAAGVTTDYGYTSYSGPSGEAIPAIRLSGAGTSGFHQISVVDGETEPHLRMNSRPVDSFPPSSRNATRDLRWVTDEGGLQLMKETLYRYQALTHQRYGL